MKKHLVGFAVALIILGGLFAPGIIHAQVVVDPATIQAMIAQLQAQIQQLQSQLNSQQSGNGGGSASAPGSISGQGISGVDLPTNLSVGSKGSGVTNLQQFLSNVGVYTGPVTGYFGSLTKQAVIAFQKQNNITPASGYVGAMTRAEMKRNNRRLPSVMSSGQAQPQTSSNVPVSSNSLIPQGTGTNNLSNASSALSVAMTSFSNEASATGSAPLAIITTSLPDVQWRTPYSATLGAVGGTGNYTWSVVNNSLGPMSGLTLSLQGVLSGSTPGAGLSTSSSAIDLSFSAQVSDGVSVASGTIALKMDSTSTPAVVTIVRPSGYGFGGSNPLVQNSNVSIALHAIGGSGNYTWSLASGSLPDGLTLSPQGIISGIPTKAAVGPATFKVQVGDGSNSDTMTMSLWVTSSNQQIGSIYRPSNVCDAWNSGFMVMGLPKTETWSVTSGTLPPGLRLVQSNATSQYCANVGYYNQTVCSSWGYVISGVPTQAGTYSFAITDSATHAVINYTITIQSSAVWGSGGPGTDCGTGLSVVTNSLPLATVGVPYVGTIQLSDANGDFTYQGNVTIPGLSVSRINPSTGTGDPNQLYVVGTPGVPDVYPAPTYPYTGDVTLTITFTQMGGIAGATIPITLNNSQGGGSLQIVSSTLPNGSTPGPTTTNNPGGNYYAMVTATGGAGHYSWKVTNGALPPGAQLYQQWYQCPTRNLASIGGSGAANGAYICGTSLTAPGVYPFTLSVTDSAGATAQKAFSINVTNGQTAGNNSKVGLVFSPSLMLPAGSLPEEDVTLGMPASIVIAGNGGSGNYTFQLVSGSFPPGLSGNMVVDPATNIPTFQISGTPSTAGKYPVTIQVSDTQSVNGAWPQNAQKTFNIVVGSSSSSGGSVVISNPSNLSAATVGVPYSVTFQTNTYPGYYKLWNLSDGIHSANDATQPYIPGLAVVGGESGQSVTLSGTPTQAGTYSFTVSVISGTSGQSARGSKYFTLIVNPAGGGVSFNAGDQSVAQQNQLTQMANILQAAKDLLTSLLH